MSPLEALLTEARPDGTFGGQRPHPLRPAWTVEQQDEHYNALADAIGAPYREPRRTAAALDGTDRQPIPRRPRKAHR